MENPLSWGPVEWTIYKAWEEWIQGREEGRIGYSMFMQIANALREEGFINTKRENSVQ